MKRIVAAAGVGLVLVLGACGNDSEVSQAGPAAGGTSLAGSDDANRSDTPGDPDTSVSSPVGAPEPEPDPGPMIVKPRPGMDNLRPVTWESAKARSERVIRVQFYGGVEPCDVLDSVKVAYSKKSVTISLFSGSDPAEPDAVCIEIAQLKAVDVELTSDLDGREIVDGSPDATTSSDADTDGGLGAPDEAPAGKVRGDAPASGVEPRPGQDNVRTITWDRAEKRDADTVRVYYTSGVEPCDVLDRVEVDYTKATITITLFMGSDPANPDAACPAIARFSYTDVDLDEAAGDREFVDGAVI